MKNKTFVMAVLMLLFSGMMSIRAYAYIDISSTTYIIQIAASVLVAAGTVAGAVFYKIKKKAKEKFNIDLDKKETEEDIVIYDESTDDEDKNA